MKRMGAAIMMGVLMSATAAAQEVAARAWQQRLHADIALPVPMVELEPSNPFAVPVESLPRLIGSTPPRRLDISGTAVAAAYVDSKGECLGAVPVEIPMPGVTSALVTELQATRFEPARTGTTARASWPVLTLTVVGRVKESAVLDQTFDLPDPANPPRPTTAPLVAPPGNLVNLPAAPQSELTTLASARRLKLKVPGRDEDVTIKALVHVTTDGRCDRFVPLDLDSGFSRWLSAFLATWRMEPATHGGQSVDCWVVYTARVQMELGSLESTVFHTAADRSYDPKQTGTP